MGSTFDRAVSHFTQFTIPSRNMEEQHGIQKNKVWIGLLLSLIMNSVSQSGGRVYSVRKDFAIAHLTKTTKRVFPC
jgi:hypothetical protein